MKFRNVLLSASALALASFGALAAFQEDGMDPKAMFEGPTEHHALLERFVGTWKSTVAPMGPDMPSSSGTETNRAFGELWTLGQYEGDFMGTPFQGHSVVGYDVEKGKYVSMWVDTASSRLNVYEGEWNPGTNQLVMKGPGKNPMTGESVTETHVHHFEGPDRRSFEIRLPGPDGTPTAMLHIDYVRM